MFHAVSDRKEKNPSSFTQNIVGFIYIHIVEWALYILTTGEAGFE